MASFFVMGINDSTKTVNSSQILPFQAEKQRRHLSIYIDDEDSRLLYIEYFPMVKTRCMAILRNEEDAQDMAHDIFGKILELKSKGQLQIPFPKTYLSTAAKNMGINKKKRARKELIEIYNIASGGSLNWFKDKGEQGREKWEAGITDNGYDQIEAEIIVKAILDEQDETTRKIYFFKYHDGMTLEQIGEVVGLKKTAVYERIKALEKQVRLKLGAGK